AAGERPSRRGGSALRTEPCRPASAHGSPDRACPVVFVRVRRHQRRTRRVAQPTPVRRRPVKPESTMNAVVLQHPNVNFPRASSRISTQVRHLHADALWMTLAKDSATGLQNFTPALVQEFRALVDNLQ